MGLGRILLLTPCSPRPWTQNRVPNSILLHLPYSVPPGPTQSGEVAMPNAYLNVGSFYAKLSSTCIFLCLGNIQQKKAKCTRMARNQTAVYTKFQGTLIFKKSCVPVSPRWSLFIKRENPLFAITSWHLSVLGGEGAVSWRHTSLDSHVPTHSEMHSQTQHERDPVFLLWKKKTL